MDGKRVFQERTNIINWADTVSDSPSVPISKPRSRRSHTLSYQYSAGNPPSSLPFTQASSLRKVSAPQIYKPVMQSSKSKDVSIDKYDGPSQNIYLPEVAQNSSPVRTPIPPSRQQPSGNKISRELPQEDPKEPSIEELQIRALKRAMSILNTHIADSKERVTELRTLLAERDIEPELFKSMQRQRWMEEKRQIATDHLSKIVEQHLVSPSTSSMEERCGRLDSVSRTTMNLVMFFESPRQRIPTRRSRVRRVHVAPQPRQEVGDVPSVHHHKNVIPLVLKPSPHVPPFLKDKVKTKKSDNLTTKSRTISQPSSINPKPPPTALAQLPSISEVLESTISSQGHKHGDSADASGSAIIWRNSPRTKEDILSDLVVNMPDYVDELLAEFDANSFGQTSLNGPQGPKPTSPKATGEPETPKPHRIFGVSIPVPKSPSRKRISALFSLADAISPRKSVIISADTGDRAKPLINTPPTSSTSAIAEEPTKPFSVSFSALPSSESGGSHEQEAEYNKRTSRLGHRLSFFKRH